ncbi:MAG TPA: ATP-binding protein [Verrucomicrobiae bacterium]|nr:ATP-binding protein [Verrucomicrobiae bacterium]
MFRNLSIKGKVVMLMMLTTVIVLVLTVVLFVFYDLFSYRQGLVRNLTTTASITAENSTAVLSFQNEEDAERILSALKADPHITEAALYDLKGNLFARYPAQTPINRFPLVPRQPGHYFENGYLIMFMPAVEKGKQSGTLYVQSDLGAVAQRLHLYLGIALLVLCGSVIFALVVSNALQRRITNPILALVNSARVVSERADYSLRVPKTSEDELGALTDAFNNMLEQIAAQTVALRDSEEKRRLAAEAARMGTWDWDLKAHRMAWDPMMHLLFGLAPGTFKGSDEDFLALIVEEDRPAARQAIAKALQQKQILSMEFSVDWPDGSRHVLVLRGRAFLSEIGEPERLRGTALDATERRKAEEEVRKLNAELETRVQERTAELTAANQEMEAFTYSVAHDLRAPLRHIDAFSRILVEDFGLELPEQAQRYLENIRNGSKNMSRLVDDLLNLARIGRQELRRQPVSAETLVADVVKDLQSETANRAIEWKIHPLPVLQCDPGLMKQVFTNLISNAVKYTRPRAIANIEIGSSQENGKTAVFVRDNGVGFNMKYADKLFGVFQRLHRAEEFEGTGVGLATVERIIRKHGGKVWAEAEPDKGATFYFTVPRGSRARDGAKGGAA